jgi:hypothetical protein
MRTIEPLDHRNAQSNSPKERLAEECSKLDPDEEMALADLGLEVDLRDWPKYD